MAFRTDFHKQIPCLIFNVLLIQSATAEITQPLTKEQLTTFMAHIMAKCSEKKVGMVEASTAMVNKILCRCKRHIRFIVH